MNTTLNVWVDRISNEQMRLHARELLRKIWLSGLGAYSLAVRSGASTFDNLVREGQNFSPKAHRQLVETSEELKRSAVEKVELGEKLLRERVFRPLDFLVVASRRDVNLLAQQVAELTAEVHRLAPEKPGQCAPASSS